MIVEDGSGVVGANSYATVDFFRTYHTLRGAAGVDDTSMPDAEVEARLVKATDYIDFRWGPQFRGRRRWQSGLQSRSILSLAGPPLDGDTVTVGSQTYTFRTSPTAAYEVEIGVNLAITLQNLRDVMNGYPNELLIRVESLNDFTASLHVFTTWDGVPTTASLDDGDFDRAASTGWSGRPQPLEFPRTGIGWMPEELLKATAEYAIRATADTPLAPDPRIDETGMTYAQVAEKVGPVEYEYRFDGNTPLRIVKPYPAADLLLRPLLTDTSGVIRA